LLPFPRISYYFVTGSDDRKLSIWDIRKPQQPAKTFSSHKGWVKNCFLVKNQLLSFGVDVRLWNIPEFLPFVSFSSFFIFFYPFFYPFYPFLSFFLSFFLSSFDLPLNSSFNVFN